MVAVAKYIDDKWYRVEILSLPGNRNVEVLYVDFGNKEVIPWLRLKKIADQFLKLSVMGLHCSLSGVSPRHKKAGWSDHAKDAFTNISIMKELKMYVENISNGKLEVMLYECRPEVDICLNAQLAKQGHARNVGLTTECAHYPKEVDLEPVKEISKSKYTVLNMSAALFQEFTNGKATGAIAKTKTPVEAPPVKAKLPVLPPTSEEQKAKSPEKKARRIPVKVIHIESPACFFVHKKDCDERLNALGKSLQTTYTNSIMDPNYTWKATDLAVVKDSESSDNFWYRAKVAEIVDNNQAKVNSSKYEAVFFSLKSLMKIVFKDFR